MVKIQSRPTRSRLATAPFPAAVALGLTIGLADHTRASAFQDNGLRNTSADPVVVYLVRHAERADDGTDDPPLALAGQIRTQVLRHLLVQAGVTHVHTTEWKRTRQTARPIAEDGGLEPSIYDSAELETFASTLSTTPGHHLVVGHSNTIPVLVEALGGGSSDPINEFEYDRLYIVVIPPGRQPVTTVLRFGEPYVEGRDFGLRVGWAPRPPEPSRREPAEGPTRERPGPPKA